MSFVKLGSKGKVATKAFGFFTGHECKLNVKLHLFGSKVFAQCLQFTQEIVKDFLLDM